jgi:exosortase H (IPTLxxWG-CTERM-specific)
MTSGAVRFLLLFAVLVGAFYAVALWPPADRALYLYLEANAKVASDLLRALAQDTHSNGLTVLSPSYAISIRRGCDGLEPAWIFGAAVLAFPARVGRKAAVLPAGIALILAANLVRIVSLYFIGSRMPALFPVAHLEVWPAVFMVLILALWIRWARLPGQAKVATQ